MHRGSLYNLYKSFLILLLILLNACIEKKVELWYHNNTPQQTQQPKLFHFPSFIIIKEPYKKKSCLGSSFFL